MDLLQELAARFVAKLLLAVPFLISCYAIGGVVISVVTLGKVRPSIFDEFDNRRNPRKPVADYNSSYPGIYTRGDKQYFSSQATFAVGAVTLISLFLIWCYGFSG